MARAPLASIVFAALLPVAAAFPAHAAIYRCTAPSGEVAYQQSPCAAYEATRVVDVPERFPAADPAQRERLFAREAALDRRLEAQRERASREATARAAAQAAAAPQPAAQSGPEITWIVPPFLGRHRHAFARPRGALHPRGD